MRAIGFAPALLGGLIWSTLGLEAMSAPPPAEIPGSGPLTAQATRQVEARIRYWLDQIRTSQEEKKIHEAVAGIVADYESSANQTYRYTYGTLLAKSGPECLAAVTEPIRQINVAAAIAGITQVTTQPALDALVGHSNPAVRYLGWEGYRTIRPLVLGQGVANAKRMCAAMRNAADKETSAPVVGAIFALAAQPPVPPTGVSEAALGVAREEGFAIVQFLWPKLWRKVLTGDREWVEAARKGMVCLGSFEPAYRSDATRRKALFQMAWDLAWCAAKAYDDAGGKGPAADACSQLLREIENALNEAKEAQPPNTWLRNALTDPKVAESLRPVRVRRAVVEDWLDFLKEDGVVKRDIVPASQPATRPSPAR